jgi:Flp pilus assembly protein TadB
MGRGKPMGGVAVVLAIGLAFLIPGALAGNLIVVLFGVALIALGCSWLLNAYRRGRPAARLEARAREDDT